MTSIFEKLKDLDLIKVFYLSVIGIMTIVLIILINSNNNLSKRVSYMEADQEYIMQTISSLEYEIETIPDNERQHDIMINFLNLILEEITDGNQIEDKK